MFIFAEEKTKATMTEKHNNSLLDASNDILFVGDKLFLEKSVIK